MKYRDLVRLIESDGWRLQRTVGSHMQFRHVTRASSVEASWFSRVACGPWPTGRKRPG